MRKKKFLAYCWRALRFAARNIIRAFFVLAVVTAALMCAAWFAALRYFNAQGIGNMLTQGLSRAFDRPVVMEGIKLVSINAVEIKNLKIIDNGESYNELVSVGSVIIRYDLLPIRYGHIVINEVILNQPAVSIIKDKDGALNTAGLKISGSQIARGTQFEAAAPDGSPLRVIIEDWTLTNGTFSYRDVKGNISHSLNGVSVRFENLRFNDFTEYDLNFVLRNKIKDKIIETEISSKGSVNLASFKPAEMALKNARFEIRGFKKPLAFNAEAENFSAPRAVVTAALPAFKHEDLSLFASKHFDFELPAVNIKAKLAFEDGFKKVRIPSLNIKNKDINIDVSGSFDAAGGAPRAELDFKTKEFEASRADYAGLLKPYSVKGKISAEGSFVYTAGRAAFPKISAELNGVSALISNFTIENVKAKYTAEADFDFMSAAVQDGVFKVGRQTVSNIMGKASYEHKKQNFYALLDKSSLFNGQKIKMSVAIAKVRSKKSRTVRTMLHVERFDPVEVFETVEDFVAALAGNDKGGGTPKKDTSSLDWLRNFRAALPAFMPNVSGVIFAENFISPIATGSNFNAEVNLKNLLPGMDKLDGKIDLRLENGTILRLQEAADRWKALGIAFQPFVIMNNMERMGSFKMGQVLKDTPFEILTASADFDKGKMDINNFYLDGRVIAATVAGRVDWVGEDMDLDIFTMFKNTSKRGVLSENLTDESGEPALSFRTSGGMMKPAVAIKSPKKTGSQIKAARERGLRTDFAAVKKFAKEN
ncbi:MAG: AsmA-like C-terminal region-containing protein [Elusimicrobiota bacterium]|jgi:hypothetical protein|nr:AsmA-like C-terminal region-containing protein [Elusimicrobiota bacterium]